MTSPLLILTFLFSLVVSSCGVLSFQQKGENEHPEQVKFCDLLHNPEQYQNRTIRTDAVYYANFENSVLYSPTCNDAQQYVWADFDPSYKDSDEKVKKTFAKLDCKGPPCVSGKVRVSVEGKFEGPGQKGYGHLGAYRFRFVISKIVTAEATP